MKPPAAAFRLTVAAITLSCVNIVPMARAQDASPWQPELHAAARLIAGGAINSADAKWLRAGIEIRLDPGWKTYWRDPGDSGLPPSLNFADSQNVKSVTTQWPAPERFADGAGGHSVGYLGHVVLPLRILPQEPAKPSSLRVKLSYAICSNLCVPAQADLSLVLSGKTGPEEAALVEAEARVPRQVPIGPATGSALAVRSVRREAGDPHQRVVVEVAAPEGVPVELFVEGPTPDWALPLPELEDSDPDRSPALKRFTFDLDGLPVGARADGATLTLTVVSPVDAIEAKARLD
jgi:DsbC/DsbD-like thiol-disulfide interchange protein